MATQHTNKSHNCQQGNVILQQLNEFRKSAQFCDVTLICNKVEISAHRNVLAAASAYFLAMFSGRFPESAKKEIILRDVDAQCLELIVDFMYTGNLNVCANNAQQLLMTASFLQVEWVEEHCANYMTKMLEAANCLGFRQFAEKQSNRILWNAANEYAITHFQELLKQDEFLDLSYEELSAFLSNEEIYQHSEDALLVGITRWVEHQRSERLQHLSRLIEFLHPPCVSDVVVRSFDILRSTEGSAKWMNSVLDSVGNREWCIYVLDKMGRTPDLSKFDLEFSTLTTLTPLPGCPFAVSLVGHRNSLYVQGGCAGRSRRDSYYYNIYHNQWHSMQPLLEPRSHHRALVIDEHIYALGGNGHRGAINSVECLNLETNTALYVESMLAQRGSMGAVTKEKCLYVMGGETDHRSLHSMERYDPREGRWHELASLCVVNSYCTSAVIRNSIYCCEGLGSSMERYDLRIGKWEMIDFNDEREFYEIFAVDEKLYSVSGEEISRYFEDINQWQTVYEFPCTREWDTAIGMHVLNYCA